MDDEKQHGIARKGGEASGSSPGGNAGDRRPEDDLDKGTRSEVGRKGGEGVDEDREPVSEVGSKSGDAREENR